MVYQGMWALTFAPLLAHRLLQSGYGTRLIPDGTITGAHFVQTPDYVQVTGIYFKA